MSNATFSRATSKRVRNESGIIVERTSNIAGFDYIPAIGRTMNLIEPSATNLILRSQEFDNASWIKDTVTVTANSIEAPDNTLTSDTVAFTGGNLRTYQSIAKAASSITYTWSVFVKIIGTDTIRMLFDGGTSTNRVEATFNINLGTISVAASSNGTFSSASAKIQSFGLGYYRISLTGTTGTEVSVRPHIYGASATASYYLWGAQFETGSLATSYIPTTTASAARNADNQSKTGASALIGQSQGMIYAEVYLAYLPINGQTIMTVSKSTSATDSRILLYTGTSSGNLRVQFRLDAATQLDTGAAALTGSLMTVGFNKILLRYNGTGAEAYVNGVSAGTIAWTSGFDALSQIYWGQANNGALYWHNHLGLAFPSPYYPTAAEAVAWTTL